MKRILCALLSVACLFIVTSARAELVTIPAKFTYQRVTSATAVPDSDWVTSPNVNATSSGWAAPNRVDSTAWIPTTRAAFNSPRNHVTGTTATTSDTLFGFRVILENNDPVGDGSGSEVTCDSMIVTIQGAYDADALGPAGQGASQVVATLVNADRLDYSSAGPKPIVVNTVLVPPVGLHASFAVGRLAGLGAIRVLVKQDNTSNQVSALAARWRVKVQYEVEDDRQITPTGSR